MVIIHKYSECVHLQGKLNNNPKASALVDEITRTLNSKKDVPTLESVLRLNVTEPSAVKKVAKNQNKKKRHSKGSGKLAPISNSTLDQPDSPNKQTVITEGAISHGKVSRRKRRRLRKKLKADSQENHAANPLSDGLTKVAQKRPCPDSPVSTNVVNTSSTKKQRTSEAPPEDLQKHALNSKSDVPALLPAETSIDGEFQWDLDDPIVLGKQEFETIIAPIPTDDFFKKYFEKHPFRIQRNNSHYDDWLSTRDIDLMLRKQRVMFGEHLDLATYDDGQRFTLNPPGRAFRSVVWDHYKTGCSVRLLCPQVFFSKIRYRLSLLQEYFGCFVGANVYLTPPGSQGFAPHYDDIEAFIMQLEGSKQWRVYAPRTPSEKLPREPSPNFTEKDLGKPMMTVTLKPGDLLYLPRGFIHQGSTSDEAHSLHLTISTYQKHTWGDFMTKLMPIALQSAIETDVEFRQGLPVGFLRHLGGFSASLDTPSTKKNKHEAAKCEDELRRGIVQRIRRLADRIERGSRTVKLPIRSEADVESESPDPLLVASDQMAVDLISQSLPPQLRADELFCHVQKQGERWVCHRSPKGSTSPVASGVTDVVELEPDTEIRLVRWSAVRVTRTRISSDSEDVHGDAADQDGAADNKKANLLVAMYHSLDNTNVYKEHELKELALEIRLLPAVDCLAKAFPDFVAIEDLPLNSVEEKMEAAIGLYEAGLIVTRYPLQPAESSDDEDEPSDDVESDVDSNEIDSEYEGERSELDDHESIERVVGDESEDDGDESVEDIGDQQMSDEDQDEVQLADSDEDAEEDDVEFGTFLRMHENSEEESSDISTSDSSASPDQKVPMKKTKMQSASGSKAQTGSRKKGNRKSQMRTNYR
ncbi:Lysine-specific demethylase NO66 [Fasciola gigantica]|uniref:Bifunctional lysine-specific demethylase and histidyl-hydroxylase n=1 Tax=Fasciola gigantica TaxID=46835 RepID=A0A504YCM4_FASGI|nr:Lysine-specific demethylase NO66 [Fasciola gigantica]